MKKLIVACLLLCLAFPGAALASTPSQSLYWVPLEETRNGVTYTGVYRVDLGNASVKAYSFQSFPSFTLEVLVQDHKLTYLSFLFFGYRSDNVVRRFLYLEPKATNPNGQGAGIVVDQLNREGHDTLGLLLQDFWPGEVAYAENPFWPLMMLFSPLEPTGVSEFGTYHPLPLSICEQIRLELVQILHAPMTLQKAPLEFGGNRLGTCCQLIASGTGADFQLVQTASLLDTYFQANGWVPDPQYVAGGPTGAISAYRKANAIALISIQWTPAPDFPLDPDRPIGSFNIPLDQQIYTVSISLAEHS